jgi:NADH-quinone oxidoreductase subunit C
MYNFVLYLFVLCSNKLIKNINLKSTCFELEVDRKNLISLVLILRDHSFLKFDTLTDICSIDKPGKKYRFTVFYNLFSFSNNLRLFVTSQVKEGRPLESLVNLFSSSS